MSILGSIWVTDIPPNRIYRKRLGTSVKAWEHIRGSEDGLDCQNPTPSATAPHPRPTRVRNPFQGRVRIRLACCMIPRTDKMGRCRKDPVGAVCRGDQGPTFKEFA